METSIHPKKVTEKTENRTWYQRILLRKQPEKGMEEQTRQVSLLEKWAVEKETLRGKQPMLNVGD